MQNFVQSGPKNLLIACSKFAPKSIHQIAQFQLQKYKMFPFLRGQIPLRHPTVRTFKHAVGADAPPNHPRTMLKTDLHPC